jgi:hypothetical protein
VALVRAPAISSLSASAVVLRGTKPNVLTDGMSVALSYSPGRSLPERYRRRRAMADNTSLIGISALIAAAVVIVAVAVVASRRRRAVRSAELKARFGPEYERAIQELGNRARAERELASRARRVEHIQFRNLSAADRSRFQASWDAIQGHFLDDPAAAAIEANELIKEVMRARGYPSDDFEHRVADLSVYHPEVVQHYRAARILSESMRKGQINTEELRQALVHYRTLFGDLLQEAGPPSPSLHRAHA